MQRHKESYAGDNLQSQNYHQQHKEEINRRRLISKLNTKTKREQNRKAAMMKLNSDQAYKEKNRARARVNTAKRLLESEEYKNVNTKRAKLNKKLRLITDKDYKAKNKARSAVNMKKRLQQDDDYKAKNRARARVNVRQRIINDSNYRALNKQRARSRVSRLSAGESYKLYQRTAKKTARLKKAADKVRQLGKEKPQTKELSTKQKYWMRRSRLQRASKQQQSKIKLQHKMQTTSGMHLLDTQLLFGKAQSVTERGLAKLKALHTKLSTKTSVRLQELPTDANPSEEELAAAFDGVRNHIASAEPYFLDHAYKTIHMTDKIPIDCCGRAHVFTAITTSSTSTKNQQEKDNNDSHDVTRSECHPDICTIKPETIAAIVDLLKKITSTMPSSCMTLYLTLDNCANPARQDRLGHTHDCELNHTCESLLRPLRIASCHFPAMRSLVC